MKYARVEVIVDRYHLLVKEWQHGDPLPEFELSYDEEEWPRDRLLQVFPKEHAPWAYDLGACPCGGLEPCTMCGGTGDVCPKCGGVGWALHDNTLVPCNCGAVQDAVVKDLMIHSSFTSKMRTWTFAGTLTQVPALKSLSDDVSKWAKRALKENRGWLFMNSKHGWGKTYFGACLLNYAAEIGMEGAYFSTKELVDFLRYESSPDGRHRTIWEWVWGLKNVPVLVLDEYGAQDATKFGESQLRDILEYRSDRAGFVPTALLTNMDTNDLPQWLSSRLLSPEVFWPEATNDMVDVRPLLRASWEAPTEMSEL